MVTIIDYKTIEKENGEVFNLLVVQGGLRAEKSKSTGKTYFTASTTSVACTFDEETCKSLIGQKMDGSVKKVSVEPYDYTIEETGEVITLTHSYEYFDRDDTIVENNIQPMASVI